MKKSPFPCRAGQACQYKNCNYQKFSRRIQGKSPLNHFLYFLLVFWRFPLKARYVNYPRDYGCGYDRCDCDCDCDYGRGGGDWLWIERCNEGYGDGELGIWKNRKV